MVNRGKVAVGALLVLVLGMVFYAARPAGRARLPVGATQPAIALGLGHGVILASNGSLWFWGNNWAGNLGLGTANDTATPRQVGSATTWVRIWVQGIQNLGQQSGGSQMPRVGRRVRVTYLPRDPEDADISSFGGISFFAVVMFLFAFGFLGVSLIYYSGLIEDP